jgi:hypothetical protein
MLVSTKTYNVLKNFHGINTGFAFRKGKLQSSISVDEDILVEATLEEEVPVDIGIYDLSKFIGNLTNLDNPTLDFDPKRILISDKDTTITYFPCSISLLKTPGKDVNTVLDTVEMTFELPQGIFTKALRIADTNSSDRIMFERKDNKLFVRSFDSKDATNPTAQLFISDDAGNDVKITFDVSLLKKLMDQTYDVAINSKDYGVGIFTSQDKSIKYVVSAAE